MYSSAVGCCHAVLVDLMHKVHITPWPIMLLCCQLLLQCPILLYNAESDSDIVKARGAISFPSIYPLKIILWDKQCLDLYEGEHWCFTWREWLSAFPLRVPTSGTNVSEDSMKKVLTVRTSIQRKMKYRREDNSNVQSTIVVSIASTWFFHLKFHASAYSHFYSRSCAKHMASWS